MNVARESEQMNFITKPYVDPSLRIIPDRYLSGLEDVSGWMSENLVSGRTIEVPNGSTIRWANRVVKSGVSNVTFRGNGLFKAHGVVDRALLELSGGCKNWKFDSTRWDCNQTEQDDTYVPYLTFRNAPLFVWGVDNEGIFLHDCHIADVYTDALYFYLGTGEFVVDGCTFTAKAHRKQQAGNFINVAALTSATLQFTNNKFICAKPVDADDNFNPAFGFGGILLSAITGRRGIISGNTFEYLGRDNTTAHRVAVIDFYDGCKNWDVSKNDILTNWTALRVSRSQDVDFIGNKVEAYGSPFDGGILGAATGILSGSTIGYAQRVRINNNTIQYVGPNAYAGSVAIQLN